MGLPPPGKDPVGVNLADERAVIGVVGPVDLAVHVPEHDDSVQTTYAAARDTQVVNPMMTANTPTVEMLCVTRMSCRRRRNPRSSLAFGADAGPPCRR